MRRISFGSGPLLAAHVGFIKKFRHSLSVALVAALVFMADPSHAGMRAMKDGTNRDVHVPDNPKRVIALAPNIAEIVFDLGQGSRLVGVASLSNHPAQAAKLPHVGSYIRPDLERIAALKPDLCLAVRDGNPKQAVDRLEALRIPVFAVDPTDLPSIMATVSALGDVLHASAQANTLVVQMQTRIDSVRKLVATVQNKPRVFYQVGTAPIVSMGQNTFIHELITLAGGVNTSAGPVPYPRFSMEGVVALSPDIIVISAMGTQDPAKLKASWMRWTVLPAVRHGRVHVIDSDLFDRPTPRLVEALEVLARLFHPHLYRDGA